MERAIPIAGAEVRRAVAPLGSVRRLGVTSRLLVLVLLPLVVLTLVSWPLALRTHSDAVRAGAASREASAVTEEIGALGAVVVEHSEAMTVGETIIDGFSLAEASLLLGPIADELHAATTVTDSAVARLPQSLAGAIEPDLARVRGGIADRSMSSAEMNSLYAHVESVLAAACGVQLVAIEADATSTLGDVAIGRAALALEAAEELADAAGHEVQEESLVWFSSRTTSRLASVRLAEDVGEFEAAGDRLAGSGVANVVAAWEAYASSRQMARYDQLLHDGELDMPMPFADGKMDIRPGTIPWTTLIASYQAVPTHSKLIGAVIGAAGTSVRAEMAALKQRNDAQYLVWVVVLALAGAGSLVVALVTARSISRPLRKLGRAAASVVGGDLDVEQVPIDGPAEIATLADAFNSLMANLRLLEAKAQALSSCDFGNEALALPLPGRLGESLQDSVHLLAGSIQDRDELQRQLAYDATHDALTGLLNRAAAIDMASHALARAARHHEATAVLYIDLDNFKQANDIHGHNCGDHVLREMGRRLAEASRGGDVVARLGGDEFLVLAERMEQASEAETLAERLIEVLSEPVEWNQLTLATGASIGFAISQGAETGADELFARADLALYHAKELGGGCVYPYDDRLQERLAEREEVERQLRHELDAGGQGFVLHFQPLVDIGKRVCGAEVLLRWQRPGHGLVPPDGFIPIAETSELIIEVDRWVLGRAVSCLAEWSGDPALQDVALWVNVSGRHLLSGTLPGFLGGLLGPTGVDPTLLTVEITETVLLNELSIAAEQLEQLHRLGVHIAIGDFGTGYTSLARLHRLPVDAIKIDRVLVSNIEEPNDASLVRMITDLAQHLGLSAVSEGVETDEQFRILGQFGSDRLQGYLIAKPMPEEELALWCSDRGCSAGAPGRAGGEGSGPPPLALRQ
ncbi:MAG TPA: EAL domain-containing protein [Acidimicrobiales bacterium]|nr:EAL domain-containing protein [Acidimicrobiales bacterium]